jgi:PTS system nitrogen regulatory IIA component
MLNSACATTAAATRCRTDTTAGASFAAIAAILDPADIVLGLDVPTRNRAFEEIARVFGTGHGLTESEVHAGLVRREKIGSTGLGLGVAIPHARVRGLAAPVAAFVRLKWAIPFDAPDGKPVTDILALLVPEEATDAHLLLLAQIADMFCDNSFRDELRACAQGAEVHATFARSPHA